MAAGPSLPIALDAMGGDDAPSVTVQGAMEAAREMDVPIILVGPARRLRRALGAFRALPSNLEIQDAPETVAMDDPPLVVLRSRRRSSLMVCSELVADGRAAGMVTAGNTGAAWVAAKSVIGMIEGVERPALAANLPRLDGTTLVLDVGANVECRPKHLLQFAVMGSLYASLVMGVPEPRVGLMSVGEEETKGSRRVRESFRVLVEAGVRFIGNVEGRHVFSGEADVIVCDGFTGNVILKVSEGLGEMILTALREEAQRSPMYGAGLLMAKGAFVALRRKVDYAEYGGAPLLGINGPCIIGHGRSSAKAVRNALKVAAQYAVSDTVTHIAAAMPALMDSPTEEST